jgi:pimeloyl-ACP methyl ester carboxylesterase
VVDVDGVQVSYVRRGTGSPVLLLHGGMSTHAEWRHQLADLSVDHDVVAWDAPGCGDSSDPDPSWDLGGFARCALGLCDRLGIGAAHVAGLSFGGGLALEVYRQRPWFVQSLALLSAYAGWRGSLTPAEADARKEAVQAAGPSTREDMRAYLGPDASDELADELLELEAQARPSFGVAGRAFAEADLRPSLAAIAVPALVMAGAEDRRCPPSIAEELHRRISGSRLLVLDGVGHCLNLEAPERVSAELRAHFAGR